MRFQRILLSTLVITLAGCGGDDAASEQTTPAAEPAIETTSAPSTTADTTAAPPAETLPESIYLGDYTLTDSEFGTEVNVTVANGTRRIQANSLPNHETGQFPNPNNPNTISAQSRVWDFPDTPTWTGEATWAMIPGVSITV